MPDNKLQPTNTMKSTDKSDEQRFGHVNATNRNSYLNIIWLYYLHNKFFKLNNPKFGLLIFFRFYIFLLLLLLLLVKLGSGF